MSLRILRPAVSLAAVALAAVSLAACGSSAPESPATSTPTVTSTPGAPGAGPGGFDMTAIQKCLTAAGISMPSGMPSGMPTGLPSRPAGTPNEVPSGAPDRAPGGAPGQLNDPKAQAALKACGISMPGAPPTS